MRSAAILLAILALAACGERSRTFYGRTGEVGRNQAVQSEIRAVRGVTRVDLARENEVVILTLAADGEESLGYASQKALNLGFGTEKPKPDLRIIAPPAESGTQAQAAAAGAARPSLLRALVIGNARYAEVPPLRNPANDARAMALSLQNLGFKATLALDVETVAAMKRSVAEAFPAVSEPCVSLLFYAGHGIQVNGANYLVPVGAKLEKESDAEFQCLDLNAVLAELPSAPDQTNLVILDACRNNPFKGTTRSASRGFAPINRSPTGTLIAFSTAPGMTAADGDGEYGLYTSELLDVLRIQGRSIEDVFKSVRVSVRRKSNGQQVPWEMSSIEGSLILNPLRQP